MTRRDWFQIGCTLLGMVFFVEGLASIARVVLYLRAFPNYQPFQNGLVAEVQLWSGVVVLIVAGILLIWRAKSWSERLFADDKPPASGPAPRLSRADLFEIGLKLLGLSLLVLYLPSAILEAVRLAQDQTGARDARGFLAVALTVGVSIVFVFQSRWVTVVVGLREAETSDADETGAGPNAT